MITVLRATLEMLAEGKCLEKQAKILNLILKTAVKPVPRASKA